MESSFPYFLFVISQAKLAVGRAILLSKTSQLLSECYQNRQSLSGPGLRTRLLRFSFGTHSVLIRSSFDPMEAKVERSKYARNGHVMRHKFVNNIFNTISHLPMATLQQNGLPLQRNKTEGKES